MDPGWTNYRKTCLYSSYDITNMLESGDNVIGVMLGNGMYNVPGGRYTKFKGTFGPPKLICQMQVLLADGSADVIGASRIAEIASDLQIEQDGAAHAALCGGNTQRGRNLDSLQ